MTIHPADAAHERRVDPSDWPSAIADADGRQIVVGGPGTGKTEFLVRRVLHLVEEQRVPTDRVLVLSFGRRGTADLEARIRDGLTTSIPRIDVATFHSYASSPRRVPRDGSRMGRATATSHRPRAGRRRTSAAGGRRSTPLVHRIQRSAGNAYIRQRSHRLHPSRSRTGAVGRRDRRAGGQPGRLGWNWELSR